MIKLIKQIKIFINIILSQEVKIDMTFFDTNNINEMFKEFKIIKYEEIEKDKKTALGQDKHWHIFDITAIKR